MNTKWTTRNLAEAEIKEIIRESGEDPTEYDLDAIAERVIIVSGRGHLTRYSLIVYDDEFWAAVMYARIA